MDLSSSALPISADLALSSFLERARFAFIVAVDESHFAAPISDHLILHRNYSGLPAQKNKAQTAANPRVVVVKLDRDVRIGRDSYH